MEEIIEARVWQKTDTEANWLANPLPLGAGEQAFVTDKNNFKVNVYPEKKTFAELEYFYKGDVIGNVTLSDDLSLKSDGVYYAQTSGTYGGVVVKEGYYTLLRKKNGVWSLELETKMPSADTSMLVPKSDLKIEGEINYTPYIVSGFNYSSTGVKTTSYASKIIEDLPIDSSKGQLIIKNIIADSLKKGFFKRNDGSITGSVFDLSVIPKTLNIPADAVKLCFCFSRNSQTEMPVVEYSSNSKNIYAIGENMLTAQKLSDNNEVPNPTSPKMAVNKSYFDANAVSSTNVISDIFYSDNKLNRDYIVTGKYINSAGEVLNSAQQHIIQNHPIEEYSGKVVTFDGYIQNSTKKLVFRDNSNTIIGSVLSLTTAPFTVTVPALATKYDMSIKGATDEISSYDKLRMNIGSKSLPFNPYKESLITTILGKKIYAEKAKGAESGGGNSFDQTLNTTDNVKFNSVETKQLIYSAIQFNLPTGNGAPPSEVQIGDAWVDTSNGNTIKVKTS